MKFSWKARGSKALRKSTLTLIAAQFAMILTVMQTRRFRELEKFFPVI
jgi:hypothetical protein